MPEKETLSPLELREEYIARVKRALLGPESEPRVPDYEHEVIAANPANRYMLGVLYPQGTQAPEDEEEKPAQPSGHGDIGEDDTMDDAVNMATQYKPSSLGFTCLVQGDPSGAEIEVRFGTYRHVDVRNHPEECKIGLHLQNEAFEVPSLFQPYVRYDAKGEILSLKKEMPMGLVHDFREANPEAAKEPDIKDFLWSVWRLGVQQREGRIRTPHIFSVPLLVHEGETMRQPCVEGDADATLMVMRKNLREDYSTLTIMLVNNKKSAEGVMAEDCIFQVQLSLTAEEHSAFRFADMHLSEPQLDDAEEENSALLYRNKKNFATGMGVSTDWNITDGVGTVRTEFFPQVEVPQMDFTLPEDAPISNEELSMKLLSDLGEGSRETKLDALEQLIRYYDEWIEGLEKEAETHLDKRYAKAATRNIGHCHEAQKRMAAGLRVLRENDTAYHAFELANRAMFMQRVQARRKGSKERFPDNTAYGKKLEELDSLEAYRGVSDHDSKGWTAYWRPFQIAFLLMDIPDIVDDASPRRDTVDLIWFPTGGGKTEAYLGLTAFTICYRRLAHTDEEAAGTTVIMRYTLRLLTTQQFNRASILICALEWMRRRAPHQELGSTPITLGLWIGSGHTPNHTQSKYKNKKDENKDYVAEDFVRSMESVKSVNDLTKVRNPFQVLKCPWCGTTLTKKAVVPEGKKNRKLMGEWGYHMYHDHFVMACTQPQCPFSMQNGHLPLQVVDDELYENPPTLLLATVDKFAMMAWYGSDISNFFGLGDEKRRAPELIIQDELHLISGALGTIVGLYETAIDFACQQKGIKPKIVAATATARKAKEQCAELYNRDVFQFPPSGLAVEDSFFAREKPVDHQAPNRFGRKYVGLMPAGKTKSMAEIRHMAVLLELTRSMQDLGLTDAQMDMLWTLTVYFGSLRNLGHALSQVSDEVQSMVERIAKYLPAPIRSIPFASELTSRVHTQRLVETLEHLEKDMYSSHPQEGHWATNMLMATNMISVGIDVPRLNQMLVIGQPKLTSEYIQSTSRIGRSLPGVAFVSYNPTNSRDRSYYEQFKSFHQAFYRQVEPSVVTPFSIPALKRALPAVVISMMWLSSPDIFSGAKDAIAFDEDDPVLQKKAESCKQFIQARVREAYERSQVLAPHEIEKDVQKIGQDVDRIFSQWSAEAAYDRENQKDLLFGKMKLDRWFSMEKTHLLQVTYEQALRKKEKMEETGQNSWMSMTSMRNVDEELDGKLIFYRED